MKPRDLAAAIRKRGWMIIVITILAALIGAVVARVQTPSYKVEIDVSAIAPLDPTTKQPNATITGVYSLSLMSSVANAMESIDVARATSDRLHAKGIDIAPEDLLPKVKTTSDVQSVFAHVIVTDSSPTRVAEIANTWGEVLEIQTGNDPASQNPDLKNLLLQGSLLVTNGAVPPKKANAPKPLVYVGLGTFLGLLIGFGTVIGIEYFDPHFRSIQEVEETSGLQVLGSTPKLRGRDAITLLSPDSPVTPASEAYSRLRSSIMFSVSGRPSKSIAVAAAIPTEEAPYFTANLASSISFTERKTLLMDCDLRQQGVSRIMDAAGRPGLADCLAKRCPVGDSIVKVAPYLYLLPAGRLSDNSSDLLSLPILDEYLSELSEEYDQILAYAPALTLAIDGAVVASKVDLSLVVIDSERCSRSIYQSAMESFNMLHLKPTGLILSNVKLRRRERAMRARMIAEVGKGSGDRAGQQRKGNLAERALGRDRREPPPREAGVAVASLPTVPPTGRIAAEATEPGVQPAAQVPAAEKPGRAAGKERRRLISRKEKVEKPPRPPKERVAKPPKPLKEKTARPARVQQQAAPQEPMEQANLRLSLQKMAPRPLPKRERQQGPAGPQVGVSQPAPQQGPPSRPAGETAPPEAPAREAAAATAGAAAPAAGGPGKKAAAETREAPAPAAESKYRPGRLPAGAMSTNVMSVAATEGKGEEELAQLKEVLAEDFRRMGGAGTAIPKEWLRALNSDDNRHRDLARIAISAYYMAFLRRYDISEESVKRITESIIKMMRKEDEFSQMSEKEAQGHLQKMLVEAGARFSSPSGTHQPPAASKEVAEKERGRKERRFMRQEAAIQKKEEPAADSTMNMQAIETKLWQDKGGEEDWEWD